MSATIEENGFLDDDLEEKVEELEIVYIQGTPHVKGADGKLYGLFPVTRPEDILELYNFLSNFNDDAGVPGHIADTSIHTSQEEKNSWETGAASAASALAAIAGLGASLEEMQGRLDKVEEGQTSDMTSNPFSVTAENLNGITLTKGIWEQETGRIKC